MKRSDFFRAQPEVEPHVEHPTGDRGRRLHRAPGSEIEVAVDELPLIPEGEYEATGGETATLRCFGETRLTVQWIVVVPNTTASDGVRTVTIPRFYNITRGPGGRVRAGTKSNLYRDWVVVAGRRPTRRQRISTNIFHGTLCTVRVRTVTSDHRQQRLSEHAQYSVVDEIIDVKVGGGSR